MNASLLDELSAGIRGQVRFDEPLAAYTTYRIGGPAAALVLPASTEDVVEVMRLCSRSEARWLTIGLGSNVLISDAGFAGIVVRLGKGMDSVDHMDGGEVWRVGAGLPTPLLARRTARAGFAGIHRLIGVPGTVGGGVAMNAGAHGQDFSQVVRSVEVVEESGVVREVTTEDIPWCYRASGISGAIVTRATLQLLPGDSAELQADIRKYFKWRKAGTPFDEPCCGSVFRNPCMVEGCQGDTSRTAGRCIDAAGLKGFRIGGAKVSERHANYIVNVGGATAADVRALIDVVREKVLKQLDIELQLEVKLIE
ncbi:MAG: UDP-N-acetylmuramate dehydrogenase [Gemmatimonadales bacterium]